MSISNSELMNLMFRSAWHCTILFIDILGSHRLDDFVDKARDSISWEPCFLLRQYLIHQRLRFSGHFIQLIGRVRVRYYQVRISRKTGFNSRIAVLDFRILTSRGRSANAIQTSHHGQLSCRQGIRLRFGLAESKELYVEYTRH